MESTWNILKKELAFHGIRMLDDGRCQFVHEEKTYTCTIEKKINIITKKLISNNNFFDELWQELSEVLSQEQYSKDVVDIRLINIFVESIKDLYTLAWTISDCSPKFRSHIIGNKIFQSLRHALARDYLSFSREQIDTISDYKICIDWVVRKNCVLSYIVNLLLFASMGRQFVCGKVVKTARGISGPWANLDLPSKERRFPWSDISEEVRGRSRDKQKQRRYRKGFENYNNDGRAGDGYYWREIKNEPFSWYDRGSEDPYPSRHTLSKW